MYITIEGVIGAGKSTLTGYLANEFNYLQVLEMVDDNPYLKKFYDNRDKWAFQTEMFFLANRYTQSYSLRQSYLNSNFDVISDYHIDKNLLFAKNTLKHDDYIKFREVFHILTDEIREPDLIVYLSATLPTIKKRINIRGREYEMYIDDEYLLGMMDIYDQYIQNILELTPDKVLVIDSNKYDFVNNMEDRAEVISLINDRVQSIK